MRATSGPPPSAPPSPALTPKSGASLARPARPPLPWPLGRRRGRPRQWCRLLLLLLLLLLVVMVVVVVVVRRRRRRRCR